MLDSSHYVSSATVNSGNVHLLTIMFLPLLFRQVFSKYDGPVVPPGGDHEALIKITNKKLGISCVWTLTKLKERLVKMRKLMYAVRKCFSNSAVKYSSINSVISIVNVQVSSICVIDYFIR